MEEERMMQLEKIIANLQKKAMCNIEKKQSGVEERYGKLERKKSKGICGGKREEAFRETNRKSKKQ